MLLSHLHLVRHSLLPCQDRLYHSFFDALSIVDSSSRGTTKRRQTLHLIMSKEASYAANEANAPKAETEPSVTGGLLERNISNQGLESGSSTPSKGRVPDGRRRESRYNHAVTNWWAIELSCWSLATLSVIILIVVLASFDGRSLRDWRSGITINTVVNVISQIGQTAAIVPVAESISQMKWIWYRQASRPVSDMVHFDDVSRKPISTLLLVWKHPKM